MFTGLIEEQGIISKLERAGSNLNIEVAARLVLEDMKLGDSIAIDGVCQTVTKIESQCFEVTAIDETLKLTNFNNYKPGTQVNLERCLRASDRLGGHIVQGHVDAVARLISVESVDGSYELIIEIPAESTKYVIHKGSICFNGISLTVAAINGNQVKVCIIPKTWEMTNLSKLELGSSLNLEIDLIAKYVENLVLPMRA
ncbi:MAG: riboflavin synthase [Cyanobacteria bacterium]|nr:riboflavin synthase [Cyanobacteriota bacterium]MDA1020540.1 riboflavin synthase [Cyanobacteriota bacterium]